MACSTATLPYLALSFIKGIGPATLRKVYSAHGQGLTTLDPDALHPLVPASVDLSPASIDNAYDQAQFQVDKAAIFSAAILSHADPEYPSLLAGSKDDPFLLYVRGTLPRIDQRIIAIVGTRKPTHHGEVIAQRIARYCAEQNVSVVSGLALGCDAVAHQSTVQHGGHTIAVLAHGLHTVAPQENTPLADAILASGGAWVSQFPFGTDPIPANFVKRDRIQAGLAQGVVLVQSGMTGGSLHASRAALRSGRYLAAVHPTDTDLASNTHSIRATRLLTDACVPQHDKAELLKCDEAQLALVKVIRTRDDYPLLIV